MWAENRQEEDVGSQDGYQAGLNSCAQRRDHHGELAVRNQRRPCSPARTPVHIGPLGRRPVSG